MTVQRSKPYPSIPIGEAVARVEQIYKKLGGGRDYDKNTFAKGMGYKDATNGAFLRSVAALIHYGFVGREGQGYALTPLARKMLIPISDSDKSDAITDAALTPQMFAAVYDEFKGQTLPVLLSNILVAKFGILDGAKNKAAAVFRKSMEDVGLLQNDVLIDKDANTIVDSLHTDGLTSTRDADDMSVVEVDDIASSSEVATTSVIKDFGHGRIAKLIIPTDITQAERENLTTLLENM